MHLSKKGAAFLRGHEGFVGNWYADPVGIGTIGVGFTWLSDSFRQWWAANRKDKFGPGARMTRAEADDALKFLVSREYGKAVDDFLGKSVAQHVYDGMVSVVFNLGVGALKWKWAASAKAGDYAKAAEYLRKTGTTAKGRTLAGLVRRRKEEAALIQYGVYAGIDGNDRAPINAMADGVLVRGESGPDVAKLISDLHALGFYKGVKDDVFGPGAQAAVMAFQRDNGLLADGKAGPETLAMIKTVLSLRAEIEKEIATPSQKPQERQKPVPVPQPIPAPKSPPRSKSGRNTVIGGAIAIVAMALAGFFDWFIELIRWPWW